MREIKFKYQTYIYGIMNTFSPLYWQLNIFSLHCQLQVNIFCRLLRMVLIAVIFLGFTIFSMYYKVVYIYHLLLASVKYTDAVQTISDYFQYVFDLFCVFKYGSDIFVEYINQYAYIDYLLDMNYYSYIKRRLIKVMMIFYFMCFSSYIFDFYVWDVSFGFLSTLAFTLGYVYNFIKMLTNLDLTSHVMNIEARLRVIGDTIQNSYNSLDHICPKIEDTIAKTKWFYNNCHRNTEMTGERGDPFFGCNDVRWLSRSYILLTEQVTFINKMYGRRVLLNSLSFLLDIVRYINLSVRLLTGTQYSGSSHVYEPALSTMCKAMVGIIAMVSFVSHCERTYKQRERIIKLIDHLILFKKLDDQLLAKYKEMRDLIVSRSITFHTDFNTLNYSWLVSLASIVVTYSIILLQNFN